MLGILFAMGVSFVLPIILFLYACVKKRYIAFLLGVVAFTGSQVLFRIPILHYLQNDSSTYLIFRALHPIMFAIMIALSAGVVEELARFIMMKYVMKKHDWQSGFSFGAGHGGIEAILFVGISALTMLLSSSAFVIAYQDSFFISGIERFFAMLLHIGLSIFVLQGIIRKNRLYLIMAMMIHGFVNATIGIFPLYLPAHTSLIAIEVTLAVTALIVFSYSLSIKRKERFY